MKRQLPEIRLDKSKFAVVALGDDSDDVEYWRNATLKQRLQHAERLRRIAYGVRAQRRLQRVIEIAKLEER
jgi:hypothetical protein